jgi:hypothetical protein
VKNCPFWSIKDINKIKSTYRGPFIYLVSTKVFQKMVISSNYSDVLSKCYNNLVFFKNKNTPSELGFQQSTPHKKTALNLKNVRQPSLQ